MRNRRPPGRPRTRTRTADEPTWGLIDIDRQTPEERKAREFAADQEALRLRRRLTEALPTGEPVQTQSMPVSCGARGRVSATRDGSNRVTFNTAFNIGTDHMKSLAVAQSSRDSNIFNRESCPPAPLEQQPEHSPFSYPVGMNAGRTSFVNHQPQADGTSAKENTE
jgi:hypothetical protein